VDPTQAAKEAAATRAVEALVRPGLRLALGTGSTAAAAVRAIARAHPSVRFDCVASSRETERLATSLGLAVRALRGDDRFDLMLDGADEVDPHLALTKGGGGALLREKLLAGRSREVAILVDPSKLVPALGTRSPIPVEVVPFARAVVAEELGREGFSARPRVTGQGRPFVTDNGNEILDLTPSQPIADPARTSARLREHVGVVETGIFVGLAHRVYVGAADGRVEERQPR
jgi:ribose 5-phosphate isomerase A